MKGINIVGMLVVLGGLCATGCGGAPLLEAEQLRRDGLVVAPAWIMELDLPGCECLDFAPDATLSLLRHPMDPLLVVATLAGEPVCIDASPKSASQASASGGATGHGGGQLLASGLQWPGDDPVPIQGEQEDYGEPLGGDDHQGDDQGNDTTQSAGGSPSKIASGISDDPVPIRGHYPAASHIRSR